MTMLLVIVSTSAIYLAADSKQFPSGLPTQKLFEVGAGRSISGHRYRADPRPSRGPMEC